MCAVSDYFNINLIVLNYDTDKYWLGKEYNSTIDEKNVVLIYSNEYYLPLIHIYGEMPSKFIYKCIINRFKIYRKLATQTELSVVEQEVSTHHPSHPPPTHHPSHPPVENKNEDTTHDVPLPGKPVLVQNKPTISPSSHENMKLKAFSNYKITELQELANKYNIDITYNLEGFTKPKNKTKRMLYDDISKL